MATEDKSDTNAKNYSETEEIPKVSLDHELSKENLEETIQLSREFPEILSDNALERMVEDENEDAICNLDQVHDAFVFCPYLKSIEMDSMMAQSIFRFSSDVFNKWKTQCVLPLMMLMTKTMENTMCSSSLPLEKCLSQYVSIKKLL